MLPTDIWQGDMAVGNARSDTHPFVPHSDKPGDNDRTRYEVSSPRSLKRSRAEYQGDRDHIDDFNRAPLRRTSSPRRAAHTDHYSPPPERRPDLPTNARHTYKPDHGDHRSPDRGQRRRATVHSPDHRKERATDPRRQSYERMSSLGPVLPESWQAGGSPPRKIARLNGRSSSSEHQDPEQHDRPLYRNFTWTNPDLPAKKSATKSRLNSLPADGNGQDTTPRLDNPNAQPIGRVVVDYQGLKDVPTGPKPKAQAVMSDPALHVVPEVNGVKDVPAGPRRKLYDPLSDPALEPKVDMSVSQSPHIFIPARALPPKQATLKHLWKFLRSSTSSDKMLDVAVDHTGYFIMFEKSTQGIMELGACFKTKRQSVLFREYRLEMIPFPEGQATDSPSAGASGVATHGSDHRNPPTPASPFGAGLEASDGLQPPETIHSASVAMDEGASIARDLRTRTSSTSLSGGSARLNPPSSPLRVPPRRERDDSSSSISSLTDQSASKQCHICKAMPVAESDPFVKCSSCPRRYHPRCHAQPPVPPHLPHDHSWQCRRCIKKGVRPKTRILSAIPGTDRKPAPSTGQVEPPGDEPSAEPECEPEPAADVENENDIFATNDVNEPIKPMSDQGKDTLHPTSLGLGSGDDLTNGPTLYSEKVQEAADDLVERSFSALRAQASETRPPKLSKPHFTRKKTNLNETAASTNPEQNSTPASPHRLQSEMAEPTGSERDVLGTPKKKPHRWSGGGADKDIIQAGSETHLPGDRRTGNKPLLPQEPSPKPTTNIDTVSAMREVPETPDARPTISDTRDQLTSHTDRKLAEMEIGDPAADLAERTPRTNGPHIADASSGVDTVRGMKPSKSRANRCGRCGRVMPFIPSQHNQYCSKCRRSAVGSVEPAASLPGLSGTASPAAKGTPDAERKVVEDNNLKEPTNREKDLTGSKQEEALDGQGLLTGLNGVTKLRAACHDCRQRRIRCEHDVPSPVVSKRPAACDDCRKRKKRCKHIPSNPAPVDEAQRDGEDGSDLDFWKPTTSLPSLPNTANTGLAGAVPHRSAEAVANEKFKGGEDDVPELSSRSSSPSEADEPTRSTPKQKRTRKHHTVAAKNEHDLGDAYSRPKNTYAKLIGMALIANAGQSMTNNAIVLWIANNIPGYGLKKGNDWEGNVKATVSHRRVGNGHSNKELWKSVERSPSIKHTVPLEWELLPGMEDELLHWDPVLKEPRSPDSSWKSRQDAGQRTERNVDAEPEEDGSDTRPLKRVRLDKHPSQEPATSTKATGDIIQEPPTRKEKSLESLGKAVTSPAEAMDGVVETVSTIEAGQRRVSADSASSIEEPIMRVRRDRVPEKPAGQPLDTAQDVTDIDAADGVGADPTTVHRVISPRAPQPRGQALPSTLEATILELINQDAENIDATATSLFDEWPEYDPANEFHYGAKIAEIKKRPNRKHRLPQRNDPWSEWKPARLAEMKDSRQSSASEERGHRASRKSTLGVSPWTADDSNVKHYDTFEEMFGLPANPIAIWHGEELAFRDGTRNEDGSLPRAREVFKSGYP